ncbi:MAG TPA: excinuclease ABC subunit UvrC [Patescibacteria group bacterium]|nr:excinuclease ABC subunit UvrC [Patescibacteria group bacterium]
MKTNQLNKLPAQPGIYRFYDKSGRLLYIGKAKNLNSRVKSYFAKTAGLSPDKREMVKKITRIEFTAVSNETEALLLESNLIKKHQPPYNIELKDDKSWLYLKITAGTYPQLAAVRKNLDQQQGGRYFGPYTSAGSVRQTLKILRKIFPYFTDLGPMVELGKVGNKYHLGRYIQTQSINKRQWRENIKQLENFLKGKADVVKKNLLAKMKRASGAKQYEQAAAYRDQLATLEKIIVNQKAVLAKSANEDYLGFYELGGRAIISLLKVREGKLLDQLNFPIKNPAGLSAEEILAQFTEKYYRQTADRPKLILTPVKITGGFNPQRGLKKKLLELAAKNAELHLKNQLASFEKNQSRADKRLSALKEVLKLKTLPQRIEVYDISNIQGQQSVGAMAVATGGQPDTGQYRRFKIKTVLGIDDPRMMAEVIGRRFKNDWLKPDLILIDGGPAQLNAALKAMADLKRPPAVISLAKKNEEIYLPQQAIPLRLPKFSPALQLLQQIRDEAHRFAVTYHRKLRRKELGIRN